MTKLEEPKFSKQENPVNAGWVHIAYPRTQIELGFFSPSSLTYWTFCAETLGPLVACHTRTFVSEASFD
uniref:Uncharacterized protein n=1 Tax=Rhizophora mucronata TaxID=61149 RepID=A0A2P2QNS5_RHIMU